MTPEKRYQTVVEMLHAYDTATGNTAAEEVIRKPHVWMDAYSFNPFYANAASLILEARAAMDARTASKPSLAALKRIVASAPNHLKCIFPVTDRYGIDRHIICNGCLIIRMKDDFPSLPHFDKNPLKDDVISDFFKDNPTYEELDLPSITEIKSFIAEDKATRGRRENPKPIQVGTMYLNPEYLLNILQALPDAVAYYPGDDISPVYFDADNGDAVLLPINPKSVPH